MLFALLAAVAFGGECDGVYNKKCSGCTYTSACAWMVGSSTCLPIGNPAVLKAWKEDNSSVKTNQSGCGGARSVESRLERLVTELAQARGVNDLDFAPSALKSRLARDMCFSDCYAKNTYDSIHCWQSQPCYDNCVTACIDAGSQVFNAKVAATDKHLTKYPTEFKCWVRMPDGCNNKLSETTEPKKWFVDPKSGNSATCKSRLAIFNQYCGKSDAESQFRGMKPSQSPQANGGAGKY